MRLIIMALVLWLRANLNIIEGDGFPDSLALRVSRAKTALKNEELFFRVFVMSALEKTLRQGTPD